MELCMKLTNFLVAFSVLMATGWGNVDNREKEIAFRSVKSYYSDDINSPYFFAGILDVCKNSNYIYVSDWKNNKIKIFNNDLKYISEFGKKGEGPGEFKQIFTDLKCDENFIYLLTISSIHIFNKKGDFIKKQNFNVFPLNKIYLFNRRFVFLGGVSNLAFFETDSKFNITGRFYKMKKLKPSKCKQLFVYPDSFFTLSKKFLVFSRFEYNISVYNLNKKNISRSIKRDTEFKGVKCVKQEFNGMKFYIPKGGNSYMLEDRDYFYYFYSGTDSSCRVDVYSKNFVLKWCGQYSEDIYLTMAGYQGDKFIGVNREESDRLVVFDLIKRD